MTVSHDKVNKKSAHLSTPERCTRLINPWLSLFDRVIANRLTLLTANVVRIYRIHGHQQYSCRREH